MREHTFPPLAWKKSQADRIKSCHFFHSSPKPEAVRSRIKTTDSPAQNRQPAGSDAVHATTDISSGQQAAAVPDLPEQVATVASAQDTQQQEKLTTSAPDILQQVNTVASAPDLKEQVSSAPHMNEAVTSPGARQGLEPVTDPGHVVEVKSKGLATRSENGPQLRLIANTGTSAEPSSANSPAPNDSQSAQPESAGANPSARRILDPVCQAASDLLEEIIHNELPIYLIYIPHKRLMSRTEIWKSLVGTVITMVESGVTWEDQEARIRLEIRRLVCYAILSHRWLPEGEVPFEKVIGNGWGDFWSPQYSAGLDKLEQFCRKSVTFGCLWAWADTCCINKKSSAELDESIRAMYRWYRNANVCIVHLRDTQTFDDIRSDGWFTRGWTLQELLAPDRMKFYNASWEPLTTAKYEIDRRSKEAKERSALARASRGSSSPPSTTQPADANEKRLVAEPLQQNPSPAQNNVVHTPDAIPEPVTFDAEKFLALISEITTIPAYHLRTFQPKMEMVRDKMLWASRRRTTRVEDMAYSLIGLFEVDMLIAYGEGERAFYRLQRAIMEQSPQEELFMWQGPNFHTHSMFAKAPACFVPFDFECPLTASLTDHLQKTNRFQSAHQVRNIAMSLCLRGGRQFGMTNAGLRMDVVLYDLAPVMREDGSTVAVEAVTRIPDEAAKRRGENRWQVQVETLGSFEFTSPTHRTLGNKDFYRRVKLGVMDYERVDAYGGPPEHFREEWYNTWSLWSHLFPEDKEQFTTDIIRGRKERWYIAILLYQAVTGPDRPYERIPTMDIIKVRRPPGGWKKPETIYFR